jgi:ATP-dependent DNA helicase RecG
MNPMELLSAVEKFDDWNEAIEVPSGIFRNNVPIYNREVIRELVANALAHRMYVMQGDIFINHYPDRVEVHSPGLLPLGVTPKNILHQSVRRNEHLAKVFYDLKLMEREGSGFDRMYQILVSDGKQLPLVEEKYDRVIVTVNGKPFHPETVRLMDKVSKDYQLMQKETIALGIIAQHAALSTIELVKLLSLKSSNDLQTWIRSLLDQKLLLARGRTKGIQYFVNPELLRKLGYRGKTTLKTIESHRLRELILTDLRMYPSSSLGDIQQRIGKEIPRRRIQLMLQSLLKEKLIGMKGIRKSARYSRLK